MSIGTAVGRFSCSSHHLSPSQKTRICARLASEYTSASIEFSQKLSENASNSAPTTAPSCAIHSSVAVRSRSPGPLLWASRIIFSVARYVSTIVSADGSADIALIRCATVPHGSMVQTRPSRM